MSFRIFIFLLITTLACALKASAQVKDFVPGSYRLTDGSVHQAELRYNRMKGPELQVKTTSRKPKLYIAGKIFGFRAGVDTFTVLHNIPVLDQTKEKVKITDFVQILAQGKITLY